MVLLKKPCREHVWMSEGSEKGFLAGVMSGHLAAFTGNAAIVIPCGFVSAHHAQLILVQVAGDVPCRQQDKHQLLYTNITTQIIRDNEIYFDLLLVFRSLRW